MFPFIVQITCLHIPSLKFSLFILFIIVVPICADNLFPESNKLILLDKSVFNVNITELFSVDKSFNQIQKDIPLSFFNIISSIFIKSLFCDFNST